jgi:cytochrome c5
MYKSYHKCISKIVLTFVVLFTAACSGEEKAVTEKVVEETTKTAQKIVDTTVEKSKASTQNLSGFSDKVKAAVGELKPQLSETVTYNYDFSGKRVIDGGVQYPVVNGKTGAYHVNTKAHADKSVYGKRATANEEKAWDIDIMPDGTGLPKGEGSVEFGEEVYEEKCLACHGDFGSGTGLYPVLANGNAYEGQKTLKNQRTTPDKPGPIRVFGSYWPYASTMWWYIKSAMPHQAPMSLTTEEVYALTAYILYINEIQIDGQLVDDEYVLNKEKFLKIQMPNKDGFEPIIDGPNGQDNAREYYANVLNYGNGKRCMTNCFDGEPKIQRIAQELKDFNPPLSTERSMPPKQTGVDAVAEHPGKSKYGTACGMCHDSGAAGAPITGDKEGWKKLLAQGKEAIYANAINGKGAMPPKGGATSLSDDEIKVIVDYMISKSE